MPIGFANHILAQGTTAPAVTIVEVGSASQTSSYAHLVSRSFTTIQDPLGIVGSPTTDGTTNAFAKYLQISNGTYKIEITAINGIPNSGISGSYTAAFSISTGRVSSSGGTFTTHAIHGLGPNVTQTSGGAESMETVNLPYNLGNITFDSSGNNKGIFTKFAAPYGGHSASMPSVRYQFTAT